jgi:glycosyltransferase involved in cell wall biosynthesis
MKIYFALIVRNEAAVIRRCLDSLLPVRPDGIMIHDTGSTDGTMEIIQAWADRGRGTSAGAPVWAMPNPWQDFATNRTDLLSWASALHRDPEAYVWMIDADDVLVFDPEKILILGDEDPATHIRAQLASMPDIADVPIHYGTLRYTRPQITRNNRLWRYLCPVHEFLEIPPDAKRITLTGVEDTPIQDGARSKDPSKFQKDADLLLSAMDADPEGPLMPRYLFYFSQCLRDAGRPEHAINAYLNRLDNTAGYQEERYVAAYNVVRLAPVAYPNDYAEQYRTICCVLDGFECSPERWELSHDLINWLWQHGKYQFARKLVPVGRLSKAPPPGLFVEPHIYDWSMADQAAIAFYYAGDYDRSFWTAYDLLVTTPQLPDSERLRILENLRWAAEKLGDNERGIHATMLRSEIL